MKIAIVTGSRDWTDVDAIVRTLEASGCQKVVQGRCSGADTIARDWAITNGIEYEDWPARWDLHGKAAGPIRNKRMMERYAQAAYSGDEVAVYAFRLGGRRSTGTTGAIELAQGLGLIVYLTEGSRHESTTAHLPGFTTGNE